MKKTCMYFILLLFCTTKIWGQVDEINKNVEKDKSMSDIKTSIESTTSSNNGNSGFFIFCSQVFINSIGIAQMAALENKDIYPERVSIESTSTLGTELPNTTIYFQTGLRLNWGIFASDFNYSNLNDLTGNLKSIDWLVVVFRIPIKTVKLDYGIGFINLVDLDQTYFKSSAGFDWRLSNSGINISSVYQWSKKNEFGNKFKENFILRVDYNAYSYKRFHVSPLVEYTYQNYFGQTKFSLYSVGLVLRVF